MADDDVVSEKFPELFHYTNVSGLESIYTKRQFWATHYENLNDSTEFGRFSLKVRDFISPKIRELFENKMLLSSEFATAIKRQGGVEAAADEAAEWHLDRVHSRTFDKHMYQETFLSSFCGHTDPYEAGQGLLSQWRGYGAEGGVAIVLDTAAIENMLRHESDVFQLQLNYMADVIYDNETDRIRKRFREVYNGSPQVLEIWSSYEQPFDEMKLAELYEKMHNDFVLGSTLVKHHAFHEENEIRIVVSPKTKDCYSYEPTDRKRQKQILYRQKGGTEVRYIELFGDTPLPIIRVIVGPSRFQKSNRQRVLNPPPHLA